MSEESEICDSNIVPNSAVRVELNSLIRLKFVRVIPEEFICILEKMLSHKEEARYPGKKKEKVEMPSREQQQTASLALQIASSGALDIFSAIKIIPNVNGKEVTVSSTDILGLATLHVTKLLNQPVIWFTPIDLTPSVETRSKVRMELSKITRNCVQCKKTLRPFPASAILFWQTMEFCNSYCLITFQKNKIGGKCHYCKMPIILKNYGLYGVRYGIDILFFCSHFCFSSHKRYAAICHYCEIIIPNNPVAENITIDTHIFCSILCSEKYFDTKQNTVTKDLCYKCNDRKEIELTFKKQKRIYKFCSQSCFAIFKLAYDDAETKIVDCVVCQEIFENHELFNQYSIFVNTGMVNICSLKCHNLYLITFRKLISCKTCLIKKFNTDMIRMTFPGGVELTTCSVYCHMMTIIREELPCEAKMICKNCNERFNSLHWYLTIEQTDVFCSKLCVENTLKHINGLDFLNSNTDSNDDAASD